MDWKSMRYSDKFTYNTLYQGTIPTKSVYNSLIHSTTSLSTLTLLHILSLSTPTFIRDVKFNIRLWYGFRIFFIPPNPLPHTDAIPLGLCSSTSLWLQLDEWGNCPAMNKNDRCRKAAIPHLIFTIMQIYCDNQFYFCIFVNSRIVLYAMYCCRY